MEMKHARENRAYSPVAVAGFVPSALPAASAGSHRVAVLSILDCRPGPHALPAYRDREAAVTHSVMDPARNHS